MASPTGIPGNIQGIDTTKAIPAMQDAQNNALLQVQQKYQNATEAEKFDVLSAGLGGVLALNAGDQAVPMLESRLEKLNARGADSADTQRLLETFKQDPAAGQKLAQSYVKMAEIAGAFGTEQGGTEFERLLDQSIQSGMVTPEKAKELQVKRLQSIISGEEGYKPTTDMQNFIMAQGNPEFQKFLQGGDKISATEQKEMFEASDTIQSGDAARAALEQARIISQGGQLKDQPKPYSGFGADFRAGLARVPVVGDIVANPERGAATTEYSNLVKEQALNNLKAIFGGMPTEGERQVLLQLQALSTYTPQEQERIIENAIQAAGRRIEFNQKKIEAIQKGDWSTLGQLPQGAPGISSTENIPVYNPETGEFE